MEAESRAKDLTGAVERLRSDEVISNAVPTRPLMEGELVNNDEETPKSTGSRVVFNQDANTSTVYRPASILSMLTDDEAGRSRGRSSSLKSIPSKNPPPLTHTVPELLNYIGGYECADSQWTWTQEVAEDQRL